METAEQNTKQVMEENDALKQFMELLNQQNMKEQSQDFMGIFWYVAGMQVQLSAMVDELQGVREQLSQMQENQPKSVKENLMDKVAHLQEKVTSLSERLTAVRNRLVETAAQAVSTFKEKPDEETAREYIAQGALWNSGVFAFKLGYMLARAHELIEFSNYRDLFVSYGKQRKISFDYAVVEQETRIQVLRYKGEWLDLGSWNTFTEAMDSEAIGKVSMDDYCKDSQVINELNIPILCMGCEDMVIAASVDGILVSSKERSAYIKPFVEAMEQQAMYAEKSWGSFTVLDVQEDSMTIKVELLPGHKLTYHSHQQRDEVWTVMGGQGCVVIDGMKRIVRPGDVITMPAGCRHTVIADTQLRLIEVQLGTEISVEDKQKFEDVE